MYYPLKRSSQGFPLLRNKLPLNAPGITSSKAVQETVAFLVRQFYSEITAHNYTPSTELEERLARHDPLMECAIASSIESRLQCTWRTLIWAITQIPYDHPDLTRAIGVLSALKTEQVPDTLPNTTTNALTIYESLSGKVFWTDLPLFLETLALMKEELGPIDVLDRLQYSRGRWLSLIAFEALCTRDGIIDLQWDGIRVLDSIVNELDPPSSWLIEPRAAAAAIWAINSRETIKGHSRWREWERTFKWISQLQTVLDPEVVSLCLRAVSDATDDSHHGKSTSLL